jgi:uncharacterized protein
MTDFRCDRSVIKHWEETPEGFLRFTAPVAKVGALDYLNADGSIRREHVNLDTLKASADSLKIKPITTPGHPPGLIDKTTAKDYIAGSTGNKVWIDDGFMWVTGTVFDGETIDAIKSGSARELSLGYSVKTVARADGDFDQIDRQINHLSPVTKARAAGAGFKLDEESNILFSTDAIDASSNQVTSQQLDDLKQELADLPNKDRAMSYKATLDGVDFEFASLDEAKHVKNTEKELVRLRSDADAIAAKTAELQTKLDDTTKELITAKATVTEQQTKLDAAEESNLDAAQIEAMIGERMKLWQEVLPFMRSDNADFEPDYTLSPLGIMTAAVKAANPDLAEHLDALDLSQDGNAGFVKGLYAGLNTKQFTQNEKIRSDADSLLRYVRDRRADGMNTTAKMSDLASEKALEEARRKRAERIANKGVAK